MFTVENLCGCFLKFGHLQFTNRETLLLNRINDFTNILIRAWLNHTEGTFSFRALFSLGCNITVLNDPNDSRMDCDISSNVEISKLYIWCFDSLEEYTAHFLVIHFNGVVHWEEEKSVVSKNISLLVIPLSLEDISLIFDWFLSCHFLFQIYNLQL
jgi:hypothetical protein